jgi:hypothetical protein
MENQNVFVSRGVSTLGLLGVAFVVMRIMGIINWSWWLVTLPFWGGLALFIAIIIILIVLGLIIAFIAFIVDLIRGY